MSTRSSRTLALLSAVAVCGLLLATPARSAAQCTYPTIRSGGMWTYLDEMSGDAPPEHLTITLINLTDYLLYNSGDVIADHDVYNLQDPFAHKPIRVKDINGDGVLEEGVPPYSSVTWTASDPPPTPQHYQGELVLELKGYPTREWKIATPQWPAKFAVVFTPQNADGWLESGSDNMPGQGTWISLRPMVSSMWYTENLFRAGVWTTPHHPEYIASATYSEMDMRNIITMANPWLVVTLYSPSQPRNIVVVVRQTNYAHDIYYTGPEKPTEGAPVWGVDDFFAQKLDWKTQGGNSVPRYNTGYYDCIWGQCWGCNYP